MTGTRMGGMMGRMSANRFPIALLMIQLAFIVLFSFTASYRPDDDSDGLGGTRFAAFQDTQLGMVMGFGLLLCFLKRYAVSALGLHLLLLALVLQWAIFLHQHFLTRQSGINLDLKAVLMGDFACLTVLVSFGVVAGKLSPFQLLFMALLEVVFSGVAHYVACLLFQAADSAFGMQTHVFGAFFGLAVARALFAQHHVDHPQASATYQSDFAALVGALVLWVAFPGMNAALAPPELGHIAVINSLFCIAAATATTFAIGSFFETEGRFCVVFIQNMVVAGGVAASTPAFLLLKPYGALLLGFCGALAAVVGCHFLQPLFTGRLRIPDTRRVLSFHALPGIVGAFAAIFLAAFANEADYGHALYHVFPAMAANATDAGEMLSDLVGKGELEFGVGRSATEQAGFQAAALAVTIGVAMVGGLATGFFLRLFAGLDADEVFDDAAFAAVAKEMMPPHCVYVPPPLSEPPAEEEVELKPKKESAEAKE